MSIILFLLILGALIFVHELGHFLLAKACKMRVDEFAIGFPPRIFSKKVGETVYALNALPLGGYVKIFGENPDEEGAKEKDAKGSFALSSKLSQAITLVAGVTFNIIFAWLLITISFMSGFLAPSNFDGAGEFSDTNVIITGFSAADTPAENGGLEVGDAIESLSFGDDTISKPLVEQDIINFVYRHPDDAIQFNVERDGEIHTYEILPEEGIAGNQKVVGIMLEKVGTVKLPLFSAMYQAAVTTGILIKDTIVGLGTLFSGKVSISQVSGPVGIVGMVGDAAQFGIAYLLTFTALISVNLAVINLLPIPALDGGRLLFVIIEGISRKNIPAKFYGTVNAIGLFVLLGFMLLVTVFDIIKLF